MNQRILQSILTSLPVTALLVTASAPAWSLDTNPDPIDTQTIHCTTQCLWGSIDAIPGPLGTLSGAIELEKKDIGAEGATVVGTFLYQFNHDPVVETKNRLGAIQDCEAYQRTYNPSHGCSMLPSDDPGPLTPNNPVPAAPVPAPVQTGVVFSTSSTGGLGAPAPASMPTSPTSMPTTR